MRRTIHAVLLGACLGAWFPAASAQDLSIEVAKSPLDCLKHQDPSVAVEYPEGAIDRQQGAIVKVRLTFKEADAAPRVEIVGNTSDERFERSVRRYVRGYRVPCLPEGAAPVDALQEFSFDPYDGRKVVWGEVRSDELPFRECAVLDGVKYPWRKVPHYPSSLISRGTGGVVLATMSFSSPTEAPVVDIVFNGGHDALGRSVADYLKDVRLTCLPAGQTVKVKIPFGFKVAGESELVLKDLTLQQFVQAISADALKQRAHRVQFDLSAMGCPFDVRLALWQPYDKNGVGEVGGTDPRREPFLNWLKTVPLALTPRQISTVLGRKMNISVPCGTLDLT